MKPDDVDTATDAQQAKVPMGKTPCTHIVQYVKEKIPISSYGIAGLVIASTPQTSRDRTYKAYRACELKATAGGNPASTTNVGQAFAQWRTDNPKQPVKYFTDNVEVEKILSCQGQRNVILPCGRIRDISVAVGLATPLVYLGTQWSCFTIHGEDFRLASVNYMISGDPKVWLSEPSMAKRWRQSYQILPTGRNQKVFCRERNTVDNTCGTNLCGPFQIFLRHKVSS